MTKKKGYKDKVEELGKLVNRGEVAEVNVYHDDNCEIFNGKECNCSPDFRMIQRDKQ